jgi:hypothetical protein
LYDFTFAVGDSTSFSRNSIRWLKSREHQPALCGIDCNQDLLLGKIDRATFSTHSGRTLP